MEQLSAPSPWKMRLGALIFGTLAFGMILAVALSISNDLRLIYVVELVLLFAAAMWIGRKRLDWIAALLLVLPSIAGFSFFTLKMPALWVNDVLWVAAVATGLVIIRVTRKQPGLAVALVAVLLIGSGWYCLAYAPKQLALHNSRTKDFSAPAYNLQAVSHNFEPAGSGKILVLDFFSTTCVPCIAELPHLVAARADLSDRRDVEFVMVASDKGDDTPEKFRAFAERKHLAVPLAFDPEGKAHDSFGVTGVPAIVVIDKTGRVRFTHEGFNPAEANFRRDLVQFIRNLD